METKPKPGRIPSHKCQRIQRAAPQHQVISVSKSGASDTVTAARAGSKRRVPIDPRLVPGGPRLVRLFAKLQQLRSDRYDVDLAVVTADPREGPPIVRGPSCDSPAWEHAESDGHLSAYPPAGGRPREWIKELSCSSENARQPSYGAQTTHQPDSNPPVSLTAESLACRRSALRCLSTGPVDQNGNVSLGPLSQIFFFFPIVYSCITNVRQPGHGVQRTQQPGSNLPVCWEVESALIIIRRFDESQQLRQTLIGLSHARALNRNSTCPSVFAATCT